MPDRHQLAFATFRPRQVFASILATVFVTEILTMLALLGSFVEAERPLTLAVCNAGLSTFVLAPALWYLVVRPLEQLAFVRQHLLQMAMSAQEEERRRIARDLHDGLGQSLTGLLVGLRTIEESSRDDKVQKMAHELRRIGGEAHDDIRRMSRGLRPAVLDDVGMIPALERFLDDVRTAHHIHVSLQIECVERPQLDEEVETSLYRIIQESVVNAARHSQAVTVSVLIDFQKDRVRVTIEDDGTGFDTTAAINKRSGYGPFGLLSIRERARMMGGEAIIESSPQAGTRVKVSVPNHLTTDDDEQNPRSRGR